MKVTTIWLNTERQKSVGRSEVDVETCQPSSTWIRSVCLSVWCEEGNWDHAQTRRKKKRIQQQNTTETKKSSMIRSLIKKITSQWALPYKLVKHFIIEYIFLYQKHKKTFILGTRKIDITGIWFNDSSPFPQVLGAPSPKSAPLAEKAGWSWGHSCDPCGSSGWFPCSNWDLHSQPQTPTFQIFATNWSGYWAKDHTQL